MELTPEMVQQPEMTDVMIPDIYRVLHVRRDTADTFSIDVGPQNGGPSMKFAPGQFNMVTMFGVGEIPISISSDPSSSDPLVHTTRAVGTVTQAMANLEPGDLIGIRGPFGTSWPIEQAWNKDVVLVAGGIGLAPLRPAMYRIMAEREKFNNVVLLYGARTPSDMLYRKQLEQWRAHFDLDVYVTVDRATSTWRGSVGLVTKLIARAPFAPQNTLAMVCGPEVMMRAVTFEFEKRGVRAEDIYLSMERNMKCGVRLCGHCQMGSRFVCSDGPVFSYREIRGLMNIWEL